VETDRLQSNASPSPGCGSVFPVKERRMKSCIFCQIIAGKVEAATLFETEKSIAILDLRQAVAGHVLVIPKAHIENIYLLPTDQGGDLIACVVKAANAVRRTFKPEGLSVWQSNGPAAFQEVPHVHFHVHPRMEGDGLLRVYSEPQKDWDLLRLKELAVRIRPALDGDEGASNQAEPSTPKNRHCTP